PSTSTTSLPAALRFSLHPVGEISPAADPGGLAQHASRRGERARHPPRRWLLDVRAGRKSVHGRRRLGRAALVPVPEGGGDVGVRSEEHTSELQSSEKL